jgi:uncharacterized membrane protein (DUF441 family)
MQATSKSRELGLILRQYVLPAPVPVVIRRALLFGIGVVGLAALLQFADDTAARPQIAFAALLADVALASSLGVVLIALLGRRGLPFGNVLMNWALVPALLWVSLGSHPSPEHLVKGIAVSTAALVLAIYLYASRSHGDERIQ